MAQPQKQPVIAAYLLTMVAVIVMLIAAMIVNLRHGGAPSLMRISAIAPAAQPAGKSADYGAGASGFGGVTV